MLLILEMHVGRMVANRGVTRVLVGKPEEERPLGRPRSRWEDNIKMDMGAWTRLLWLRMGTGGGHL